jgi:hypothetical protein
VGQEEEMTFDDFIGLCLLAIALRAVYLMYWRDSRPVLQFTISCDASEALDTLDAVQYSLSAIEANAVAWQRK